MFGKLSIFVLLVVCGGTIAVSEGIVIPTEIEKRDQARQRIASFADLSDYKVNETTHLQESFEEAVMYDLLIKAEASPIRRQAFEQKIQAYYRRANILSRQLEENCEFLKLQDPFPLAFCDDHNSNVSRATLDYVQESQRHRAIIFDLAALQKFEEGMVEDDYRLIRKSEQHVARLRSLTASMTIFLILINTFLLIFRSNRN